MHHRFIFVFRWGILIVLFTGMIFQPLLPAYALASLSVTPLTWNIIGLDSNNVNVGPNHFPIGARVCNTSLTDTATNVKSNFVFDDGSDLYTGNAYINLRGGTLSAYTTNGTNLAPGACTDFYYEVEVTRDSNAYNKTRRYHITASSDAGAVTGSTPTPRELFVEHLVSQSRNAVTDVQLNGVPIPAGGTMSLVVGNTYTIKLIGYTATQGYNQLESFINFPNTIFQVLSVSSVYSAPVPNYTIDKLYSDACGWDNVLSSPTYRSCIVSDDKSGGSVAVTYQVKILQVPAAPLVNPEPLSTLIYDFSGSSYHYNSDFGISARYAQIINPASAVSVSKAFSPNTIPPGGTSTLTVTLSNSASITISGANFSDTLPVLSGSQMVVATPATYSTSGCGSAPTLSFTPVAGASSFSVAGATIAPNGSCTINLSVSVPTTPTTGAYQNTITDFRVGTSPTAGISSNTANLTVDSSAGSSGTGLCGQTLATWTFPGITTNYTPNPAPTINNLGAGNAVASAGAGITNTGSSASPFIRSVTHTADGSGSWSSNGLYDSTGALVTANNDYFEFAINTTGYTSVTLNFWAQGANTNAPEQVVVYSGTTTTLPGTLKTTLGAPPGTVFPGTAWASSGAISFTSASGELNTSGLTYFRIYGAYAKNNNPGSDLFIDDVAFTGCGPALKPTITKAFNTNPVVVNGTSTLSFTITNPNTSTLNGLQFTDTLPVGLTITDSGPTTICGGTLTTTAATGAITFTGGVLASGASCTITTPAVTATTAGPHPNVSGFISSTESGTNSTSTGSAKSSLVAVLPPTIEKAFNPNPILSGQTTTLTFTITNPNPGDALSNVAFSDTFPTTPGNMVVAATPNASASGCGTPTFAPVAGAGSISFSGGTLAAGGTCTVQVNVSVPAGVTGSYANTSSAVTTTIGGLTRGTDTASSTLTVNAPNPSFSLSKQISTNVAGPWSKFLTVVPGNTVYYKFTLENTGDVPLTLSSPVINDPNVNLASCTWPATLPVASPSSDPTATCTVSVTAVAGDHPNTATANASYGGTPYTSTSSADYFGATPGLNLSKQISTSASGPWSASITNVVPGSNIYYRFTVINTSALDLSNITVVDPQVSPASCIFTDPLPANNSTSCVVGPITAALTGSTPYTNTAHATGENGGTTYTSPDSTASYTLALPSLGLTKSNGSTQVSAGGTTTYTLTVSNTGNAATSGLITLVDVLPTGLSVADGTIALSGANAAAWSCTAASNVLTCTSNTAIAASGTSVFSFAVNVASNATGTLLNKAQVGGGGDPSTSTPDATSTGSCSGTDTPTKGCAVDSDTVNQVADLSITKTDNSASYIPGTAIGYTVIVTNNGPSIATNATIADAIPANITGATWTCAASTGASCTASGSGNINDTVTIPSSGNVTYTVIGVVSGTATGNLSNTGTTAPAGGTTDPVPGNNSATDTDTPAACTSGPFASWTFTGNTTKIATGAGLFTYDTVGLNAPTWNASQVSPGDDPAISFTGATSAGYIANNDYVDFAVSTNGRGAITMSFADTRSGTGPNSFVVYYSADGTAYNPLPPGTVYAISALPTWTARSIDFSTITGLNNNSNAHFRLYAYGGTSPLGTWRFDNVSFSGNCLADLSIAKDDGMTAVNAGGTTTYTIRVTNNGLASVTGAILSDPSVSGLNKTAVACSATPGQCTVAPTVAQLEGGAFALPALTSGQFYEITVTATVTAGSGTITNTAAIAPPSGITDPTSGNNSASDSDDVNPVADLVVTKSNGVTSLNAGAATTYIIRVTNNGPSSVTNATLGDPAATGLNKTIVACSATPGQCSTAPTIAELEGGSFTLPTLASGEFYEITVTATVTATSGSVSNVVTAAPPVGTTDPTPANNTNITDTDTVNSIADLVVTKSNGVTSIDAGGSTTYTLTLTNNGPSAADNATISDPAVTGLSKTALGSCTASGGAVCPAAGAGAGQLNITNLESGSVIVPTLPNGGSISFTVTVSVTAVTGNVANTFTAAPPAGTTDLTPATDTDTDTVNPRADLEVTKTDGTIGIASGATTSYAIVVTNHGPSTADNTVFTDPVATGLNVTGVTCGSASGGAVCSSVANTTVALMQGAGIVVPTLPSGGTVTFTVNATITASSGTVTNTANVALPSGVTDPGVFPNNASDTDNIVLIDAVNDVGSTVNGTSGGQSLANVLTNDSLNGTSPVLLADVNLTQVSTTNPNVTLNPATGTVNVAPGTPYGNYTVTYQICDKANPTICDTATVSVPVVVIDAANDTGASVNGASGGQSLSNVLTNDILNGAAATLSNINLTQISTTDPGVTLDPLTGAVNVAAGTPTGNYIVSYQICDKINTSICDTAMVTVPVVSIDAIDDTGSTVNGISGGQSLANVLTNDSLSGTSPVLLADVNLTQVSTSDPNVTLNPATAAVNVAPNTPAGNYTVAYQICDKANPTICDTATVSVPVVVINAVDDTGSTVNGTIGGQSVANVLVNDTLNASTPTLSTVILTRVSTTNPNVTLDPTTGAVNVAAGTPAGNYTVTYQICDQANPTICDTATVTVTVNTTINAVNDDFSASAIDGSNGGTTASVINNDTTNGVAAVIGTNVTLTSGSAPTPADGSITMNPDGTITVAAGTTAGIYTYAYTTCTLPATTPATCDTASATVKVNAGAIDGVNDDYSGTPVNSATGGNVGNAFANDTLNGAVVVLTQITATIVTPASNSGVTLDLGTGSVDVAAGTPAGTYTIVYKICENINPTNCDTATITVLVSPSASISGVVFNDANLDGSKAGSETGLAGVTVNLYDSTGITLIATTMTGVDGTYTFPNLAPGSYRVTEIDPAGYVSSTANTMPVTNTSGGTGTANFGDYQLPNTLLSSISGVVFDDANANGIQDASELPLSGVTVELKNNLGTVIGTVITGSSGTYGFLNLAAGTYTVIETDLAGYISTTLNNVAVNLSAGTHVSVYYGDQLSAAVIADPAVTKFGTPANAVVGDIVVYTITVGNNGSTNATNVILTDTKPAFLDIISITISPDRGLTPVITGNTFTINVGTVTPTDLYVVTVLTRVNSLGIPPGDANMVQITSASSTDRLFNNSSAASLSITSTATKKSSKSSSLPATGFAPNVVTKVLSQPKELKYAATDVILEIPSIGVEIPIVGVPQKDGTWNVSWLEKQAGWLQGTAFPSWSGNSVLTGHVYMASGLPGPFINLSKLKYGDKIIVHAYGQKYTFEVQTNLIVAPNDQSVIKHEEKSWVTLVTCKDYDEKTKAYLSRVVVRAVLVKVVWE